MKALIFIIALSTAVPCFSQLEKAEKWYRKQDYEKCLNALTKVKLSKETRKQAAQLKMKCNYNLYLQQHNNSTYDRGLAYFIQLYRADKKDVEEEFVNGYHQSLKQLSRELMESGNHRKAKVYATHLAYYFKDSTSVYFFYYPPKKEDVSSNRKAKTTKSISRDALISYSETLVGVKYKWGGEDTSGLDCSGFVLNVLRKFNYSCYHSAREQSTLGMEVDRNELKPGDLVFFGKTYSTGRSKIDHVAMVYNVNADKLIVIHSTSKGVNIQELKEGDYWSKKILFYKNVLD